MNEWLHRNEFKTPRTSNRNKKKDKVSSSRNQVRGQEESEGVQPKKLPDDEGILEEKDKNMVENPMESRKRVESTKVEQLGTNKQVDNHIHKKPSGEARRHEARRPDAAVEPRQA